MISGSGPVCEQTLAGLREEIARLLPEAMERAVASYRDFVALNAPTEAKHFKEHHMAGRTALAHLEALLKLARWATDDEAGVPHGEDAEAISAMVGEAQRAIAHLEENE